MTNRPVSADDILATLTPERQARIRARGAELIAEEFALRDLRRAEEITQATVAERVGWPSGLCLAPREARGHEAIDLACLCAGDRRRSPTPGDVSGRPRRTSERHRCGRSSCPQKPGPEDQVHRMTSPAGLRLHSCRNGLVIRSSPSVLVGAVAGNEGDVVAQRQDLVLDGADELVVCCRRAGRCGRPSP